MPLEDPDDEEERESFFERAIRNPESFHQKHRPTFKKVDGCANTVLIRDEETQNLDDMASIADDLQKKRESMDIVE